MTNIKQLSPPSVTIDGKGIRVQIIVKDELDEQIVDMALSIAIKRNTKLLPAPKDTPK